MKKIVLVIVVSMGVSVLLSGCTITCSYPSFVRKKLDSSDSVNHVREIYEDSNGQKMIITRDTILNMVVGVTLLE